ncbi:MAG: glycosyltransferase [Pseudomonadota bacterium]
MTDLLGQDELSIINIVPNQFEEYSLANITTKAFEDHITPYLYDQIYQNMTIKDKYKVVFITNEGGEESYDNAFKFSAERIGWEVQIYMKDTNPYYKEILDFNPDFMLFHLQAACLPINTEILNHTSKKYFITHGWMEAILFWKMMLDDVVGRGVSPQIRQCLQAFDGLITLSRDIEIYKKIFVKMEKEFIALDTIPLTSELMINFTNPEYIFWCGIGWDNFRSSQTFKSFIKNLSDTVPMKVYGSPSYLDFLTEGIYNGYTPPGIPHIEAINKAGIYLLTHSDLHIEAGVPTYRLFEALAANVIIISDKHPFVIKNFGDNILYYDQYADSNTMYTQVKAHYDWIKASPEEAKLKAKNAHQIFLDNFTIEKDLPRIAKMHEFALIQGKANY